MQKSTSKTRAQVLDDSKHQEEGTESSANMDLRAETMTCMVDI
jgi:hypothetical protein